MTQTTSKTASPILVIIAFATVYIVWGSTYFFIKMGMEGFPPLMLGAVRFFTAGMLMLLWYGLKGERLFIKNSLRTSAVTGVLVLVLGNGAVIWGEQTLPSAMVAILCSSAPIAFVLLDRPNWRTNLTSQSTVAGLVIGFAGVVLLFGEQLDNLVAGNSVKLAQMILVIVGAVSFAGGSIYSKHHPSEGSPAVNVAWQMIVAGLVFLPFSLLNHEFANVAWTQIPMQAWLALAYLIVFGSIAAYSAYVWLLQVRPATQVSTYAYINPVIAVVLGVLFAGEPVSLVQMTGLVIILGSVLLINLSKYRQEKAARPLKDSGLIIKPASQGIVRNSIAPTECAN